MQNEIRIGVYVCFWGVNIGGVVDVEKVAKALENEPNVVVSKTAAFMCSSTPQNMIKEDIEKLGLNRIVVGACTPKIHEPTYRALLESAGISKYFFEMVNLREQVSFVHAKDPEAATQKAIQLMKGGIARANQMEDVPIKEMDVYKSVMVIGGGIGGISAALGVANTGTEVHLVESSPSIGGKMAQLDRVFPTDDCAIWILAPKMVEVGKHPNVQIHTYTEVEDISGTAGQFKVKLKKKTRFVDEEICTGCGRCMEVCPVQIPNEFNYGLGTRKAINILFPQAVPKVAYISKEYCIDCKQCEKNCLAGAIKYEQEPEEIEIEVGAIIIATGYDVYDATGEYGYKKYLNVITQIELERMLSPTGPTGGHILRPSDGKSPKRLAMIQCVGSRNIKGNAYCSGGVCCMVAIKNAQLLMQEFDNMELTIFYIDIRTADKDQEEYYSRIRGQNPDIRFIRGKIGVVKEDPETKNLILRGEDTLQGKVINEEFDMVVLSVAMVPAKSTKHIMDLLGLDKAPSGFLKEIHGCLSPQETKVSGVYICGAAHGPKNVPYSVSTAKAAAIAATDFVLAERFLLELINPSVIEELCVGCGTCERNCPYGAITINEKGIAEVNEMLCKGCGICVASCPARALSLRYYRDETIDNQVAAMLKEETQI